MDATPPEAPPIAPRVSRRPSTFAGDVFKLVSGTTIAQVIGVLVTPLLTRIPTRQRPSARTGAVHIHYQHHWSRGVPALRKLAIMLPETDEEAANLAVSLLAVVAITALTVPVITLGGPAAARLNASQLGPYLWVVPPRCLAGGVFYLLSYWSSRTRQFGRVAAMRVVNAGARMRVNSGRGMRCPNRRIAHRSNVPGHRPLGWNLGQQGVASGCRYLSAGDTPLDIRAALVRHRHFPLYGS